MAVFVGFLRMSNSGKDGKDEWMSNNDPKMTSTNILKVIQTMVKNQQVLAQSIQQLLSGLSDKMKGIEERLATIEDQMMEIYEKVDAECVCIDSLTDSVKSLDEKMQKTTDSIVEKDVRERNRRLRSGVAFSFQPQKTANF